MMYTSAIILVVICISLQRAFSGPAPTDTPFMKEYDQKVCNNEPSCNLTLSPGLPPNRLTLEKRDCMCDFECVQYNDCCKDSQYFNSPTLDNSPKDIICSSAFRVYMITSCSPDYTDEEVKAKCAKALQPLDENDFAINRPVTNTAKRFTYANAYCALCNNDENIEPWTLKAGCGVPPAGYLNSASAATNPSEKRNAVPSSTPTSSASTVAASTASSTNSDKSVKVNLHFDPGSVFGGKSKTDGGYNKEFSVPTFGLSSKALNKTIGSQTGLFGAKIGRSKRQTKREDLSLNFPMYARKVNEILKTVKWDDNVKDLVGRYEGKDFICRLNASIPENLEKYMRKCVPDLVSECPNDPEANKLCQSYTQIVYEKNNKKPYKNRDCARCNGLTDANITGCPPDVRGGASGLFSTDGKGNANNAACANEKLAAKFC